KEKKAEVQTLDLKEIIPDYLKTSKIPRGIRMSVCRAVDDFMSSNGGLYAYTDGTKFELFFEGMSGALAKSKAQTLSTRIQDALKGGNLADAMGGSGVADGHGGSGVADKKKTSEGPGELARVLKEGLPENPDEKVLLVWAQRMLQEVMHMAEGRFLPKELLVLGSQYKPQFYPVWFSAREVINGSFFQLLGAPAAKENGEKSRQCFSSLVAGVISILKMLQQGGQGIVYVPVQASLFLDKDCFELYTAILRVLPNAVKQCIGFEVKGLSDPPMSEQIREKVLALSKAGRAMALHTSVLSPQDYSFSGFKPQVYVLSCAGYSSGILGGSMKKSADFCKSKGIKSIASAVRAKEEFAATLNAGCDFICGPFLGHGPDAYGVTPLPKDKVGS
ncbi:MAG: hypothetical protein HY370_05355, partial [Proteobacteria bacterium]|nr:hypothetical protein [Pseudomonadota bacterium]